MKNRRRNLAIIAGITAAVVGCNILTARSDTVAQLVPTPPTVVETPPSAPEPQVTSTTTNVTSTTANGATVKIKGSLSAQPTIASSPAPSQPTIHIEPGTPHEVINVPLNIPLRIDLRPGQQSAILNHIVTNGMRYNWRAGENTIWKDQPHTVASSVWAEITTPKPAADYVSDRISFTVRAAATAQSGTYNVRMILVIRPTITVDIPVQVVVKAP